MSKISKSKEVKKLAWSTKDWIHLARVIPNTNRNKVKNIMIEFQRAVLPKTKANIRLCINGEGVWENISDEEFKTIESARTIWGLKKDKLQWNREHELLTLKIALRLWKYKSDSPILSILTEHTNKRKKWLLSQLQDLNKNKVWDKLENVSITPDTILDSIQHLNLNQAEVSVIKRWKPIADELFWKQKQTTAIRRWLSKNTHVPSQIGTKWIDAWTYQAETSFKYS